MAIAVGARERHGHAGRIGRVCVRMLAALGVASVAGCATFDPPKPWEKGDLARPSMRLDADPLAARGGTVGGGGCGCN